MNVEGRHDSLRLSLDPSARVAIPRFIDDVSPHRSNLVICEFRKLRHTQGREDSVIRLRITFAGEVPEPGSVAMLGFGALGLAGLAAMRRR